MSKKVKILSGFFAIVALCSYVPVFADSIVLKSGEIMEGTIVEETDKYVKIDYMGVPLTYWKDNIEKINKDSSDSAKPLDSSYEDQQQGGDVVIVIKEDNSQSVKDFVDELDSLGKDVDGIIFDAQRKIMGIEDKTLNNEHRAIMEEAVNDIKDKIAEIKKLTPPPGCRDLQNFCIKVSEAALAEFSSDTRNFSSVEELGAYWLQYETKLSSIREEYKKERNKIIDTPIPNESLSGSIKGRESESR